MSADEGAAAKIFTPIRDFSTLQHVALVAVTTSAVAVSSPL
jgi:hypothetical protein